VRTSSSRVTGGWGIPFATEDEFGTHHDEDVAMSCFFQEIVTRC